jgi:hypothetical protein
VFITLFGIATRNGILLISHYKHQMEEEGKTLPEAVLQGSMERLRPAIMTALAAGLALVPFAFAADKPGNEILSPLAIVILGGADFIHNPEYGCASIALSEIRQRATEGNVEPCLQLYTQRTRQTNIST